MPVLKSDSLPLRSSQDIVVIRQTARQWAAELGFSVVDQTKIVTAAERPALRPRPPAPRSCRSSAFI
jgi:serine/threonine-protein kinase RsbT